MPGGAELVGYNAVDLISISNYSYKFCIPIPYSCATDLCGISVPYFSATDQFYMAIPQFMPGGAEMMGYNAADLISI